MIEQNKRQPAAAQEAVATVESYTNGSYHRNYKLRWHKDVDAGTQLFAAPVAAAPADTWFADQLTAMGEVIPLDSTPAAPGIDPHVLARDIHHAIADTGLAPLSPADNYTLREVIRSVIDASPKGAADEPLHAHYCNAQPASAECICGLDSPKGGSEAPTYTTGHCENHKKPGGCPLHNLQCGYPQCDRRQAGDAEVQR